MFEVGRGVWEAGSGMEHRTRILWERQKEIQQNGEDVVRLPWLFRGDEFSGCVFHPECCRHWGEGRRAAARTTAGNLWSRKFSLWVQRETTLEVYVRVGGLSTQGLPGSVAASHSISHL